MLDLLKEICETPAPTFEETERGTLVKGYFEKMGLSPRIDHVGNVIVDIEGGSGPRVLFAAHLDTVFPAETDVTVKEKNGKWCAPGIGDNSASLAVLIYTIQELVKRKQAGKSVQHPKMTIAATIGEEGIGDLYGIRELVKEGTKSYDMMVAVDGHLNMLIDSAVGSKRYQVNIHAEGGHSWGNFPSPSATHALGDMIAKLNKMHIPTNPRCSYNIGQISGGTSINAIAQDAEFNLDLRSVESDALDTLEKQALDIINQIAENHSVTLSIKKIGDRPVGIVDNRSLVEASKAALKGLVPKVELLASSTDANAALAKGIPAVCFGVYHGGDAHRLSEWMDPKSLEVGFKALNRLMENTSKL